MKRFQMLAVVAAVVVVLGIAFAGRLGLFGGTGRSTSGVPAIGGPFTLTDQSGRTVTDQDYRGRYLLIYFGYTFCPDVCPTSLSGMAAALELVPKTVEEKIQPIFITIDPARDTTDVLKSYVANFHSRMVGLTGTEEQIRDVARKYRVYYQKVDQGKDAAYLMDHSSIIYLMGPDGQFLAHFSHTTPPEQMAETIAKVVEKGGV